MCVRVTTGVAMAMYVVCSADAIVGATLFAGLASHACHTWMLRRWPNLIFGSARLVWAVGAVLYTSRQAVRLRR